MKSWPRPFRNRVQWKRKMYCGIINTVEPILQTKARAIASERLISLMEDDTDQLRCHMLLRQAISDHAILPSG